MPQVSNCFGVGDGVETMVGFVGTTEVSSDGCGALVVGCGAIVVDGGGSTVAGSPENSNRWFYNRFLTLKSEL